MPEYIWLHQGIPGMIRVVKDKTEFTRCFEKYHKTLRRGRCPEHCEALWASGKKQRPNMQHWPLCHIRTVVLWDIVRSAADPSPCQLWLPLPPGARSGWMKGGLTNWYGKSTHNDMQLSFPVEVYTFKWPLESLIQIYYFFLIVRWNPNVRHSIVEWLLVNWNNTWWIILCTV